MLSGSHKFKLWRILLIIVLPGQQRSLSVLQGNHKFKLKKDSAQHGPIRSAEMISADLIVARYSQIQAQKDSTQHGHIRSAEVIISVAR